ncbi:radical SAM protein [Sporomusa sphaeroides]|uniref:radical SAM protein n=1 Tax=Sporomusa sphaeroides TaxID=47679 RepID=UPI003DA0F7BA
MLNRLAKTIKYRKYYIARAKLLIGYHLKGDDGSLSHPNSVGISVNNVCNLRCVMCDIGQQNASNEYYKNLKSQGQLLSLEDIKTFIDDIAPYSPSIIVHSTEPLLYNHIIELSEYIIKKGLVYSITTNGYLLDQFAEAFVKMGLPAINISIDGPPAIHNQVRGVQDSFEKALQGIEKLIEWKKRLQQAVPVITITSTILNTNAAYLTETVSIFKKVGVDNVKFTHFNFIDERMANKHNEVFGHIHQVSTSSVGKVNPKEMDIKVLIGQIQRIKTELPKSFVSFSPDITDSHMLFQYYNRPENFLMKRRCLAPWTNLQLLSNGDVIPAARCFNYIYGNIKKTPFSKVWKSERAKTFRKELKKIGAAPACSRCCGLFSSI